MKPRRQIVKSALLGVLILLLLNFPFLGIANRVSLIFSVPVLYVYVFGIWILFIALLFFVIDNPSSKLKKGE